MKLLLLLAFGLPFVGLLAGCGYVDKFTARQDYKQAVDEYRRCLRSAPSSAACQRERAMMSASKQAFGTMAAGVTPWGTGYYQFSEDD